jgi:hypothetical protein
VRVGVFDLDPALSSRRPAPWQRAPLYELELLSLPGSVEEGMAGLESLGRARRSPEPAPFEATLCEALRSRERPEPVPGAHLLALGRDWQALSGEPFFSSFVEPHDPSAAALASALLDMTIVELDLVRVGYLRTAPGPVALVEVLAVHALTELGDRLEALPELDPTAPALSSPLLHGHPLERVERDDRVVLLQTGQELCVWIALERRDGRHRLLATWEAIGGFRLGRLGARWLSDEEEVAFGVRRAAGMPHLDALDGYLQQEHNHDAWADEAFERALVLLEGFTDEEWAALRALWPSRPEAWQWRLADVAGGWASGLPILEDMVFGAAVEVRVRALEVLEVADEVYRPSARMIAWLQDALEGDGQRYGEDLLRTILSFTHQ